MFHMPSVSGTLVERVIGIKTVAFVVGGSVVLVDVKEFVTSVVVLSVAVLSEGIVTTVQIVSLGSLQLVLKQIQSSFELDFKNN